MTAFDYIIFLIYFVAIVMGLARGVVREIVSLIIIVVALIVTIKFTLITAYFIYQTRGARDVVMFISRFIYSDWEHEIALMALNISFLVLFVGTMSVVEAVNSYVFPNTFMSATLSLFYRVAGAGIGFIRGTIFSVITILVLSITPFQYHSAWVDSIFVPKLAGYVKKLGDSIQPGGYGSFDRYR